MISNMGARAFPPLYQTAMGKNEVSRALAAALVDCAKSDKFFSVGR